MQGLGVDYRAGIHIHPMPTLCSVWPECVQHLLRVTTGYRKRKGKYLFLVREASCDQLFLSRSFFPFVRSIC